MEFGYVVSVSYMVDFEDDNDIWDCTDDIYVPTLDDALELAKMLSGMGQTVTKISKVYEPADLNLEE